jgi:hypothetical protein
VFGHDVSASVAIEKLVAPVLSQQPLVLGALVQAAAAEVVVDEAEVVEEVFCLLPNLTRFESGSTEAPTRPRSKLKENLVNNMVVTRGQKTPQLRRLLRYFEGNFRD